MIDRLDIRSGFSRQVLMDSPYLTESAKIKAELDYIEFYVGLVKKPDNKPAIDSLRNKLGRLKDIRGTIARLKNGQVLDDTELFEIKSFALLSLEIANFYTLPDLNPVVMILDPERTQIPHFYIYDSYSPELERLRRQIKELKKQGADEKLIEDTYNQSLEIEDNIRRSLSDRLKTFGDEISDALMACAELDIRLAKAQQAADMHLCRPQSRSDTIGFRLLFNPEVKDALQIEGKDFQAIDINIENGVTLITGANMTGKSVVLKTVALAQVLFQFAFFVPAASAHLNCVNKIFFSMGDEQDELNGLSSYAAEMLNIHHILQELKSGTKALILIDEPARTTNPEEGKAIVNALIETLGQYNSFCLITTHYSGICTKGKKLRVKGLLENEDHKALTIHNINQYIDYSLIEDSEENVPHEAIRIARILGVDEELLDKAENQLAVNSKQ